MVQHEAVTVSPAVAKQNRTFIAIPSGVASMAFSFWIFQGKWLRVCIPAEIRGNGICLGRPNLLPTVVVAYQFPCNLRLEFFQWQGFSIHLRDKLVQYVCIGDCDIKDELKNVLVHLV